MLSHISTALSTGQVLVLGDLNAHTCTDPDYIDAEADAEEVLHGPVFDMMSTQPVSTARQNQDRAQINPAGAALLNICQLSGLRIVNGRTAGDRSGAVTFRRGNGSSLVDYAVACPDTMQMISSLAVEQDGTLSDHYALRLQLDIPAPPVSGQDSNIGGSCTLPRRMKGTAQL